MRVLVLAALGLLMACDGRAETSPTPPSRPPVLGPPGTNGAGAAGGGPATGGASSQGGAGQGGQGGLGGGGTGGEVPVSFDDCGCALQILDTTNTECGDCVQLAKDEANDPCFQLYDDCLVNVDCLAAEQRLIQQCSLDRTTECAEAALAGTPNGAAADLIAYYGCLCQSCGGCDPSAAGGGGAGGGVAQTSCVIAP